MPLTSLVFEDSSSSGTINVVVESGSPTVDKINKLSRYEDGWRFGEGEHFPKDVVEMATRLHLEAVGLGFLQTGVFPGLTGELILTVYQTEHCLEFTINSDLKIDYVHEVPDSEDDTDDGLSADRAVEKMRELRNDLWNSSDYSKWMNSTANAAGSLVQRFSWQATGEFPLSIGSASPNEVLVFAHT